MQVVEPGPRQLAGADAVHARAIAAAPGIGELRTIHGEAFPCWRGPRFPSPPMNASRRRCRTCRRRAPSPMRAARWTLAPCGLFTIATLPPPSSTPATATAPTERNCRRVTDAASRIRERILARRRSVSARPRRPPCVRRLRLTTPAVTSVNTRATGSGSSSVNAMLTSGFLYISPNSRISFAWAAIASADGAGLARLFERVSRVLVEKVRHEVVIHHLPGRDVARHDDERDQQTHLEGPAERHAAAGHVVAIRLHAEDTPSGRPAPSWCSRRRRPCRSRSDPGTES